MLNWKNLLKNKCPKCSKKLDFTSDPTMMMCTISCGFMVSVQKMSEVCGDIVRGKIDFNLADIG